MGVKVYEGTVAEVSESRPEGRRKVGRSILRWMENEDGSGMMEAKVKQ
jgi:hypothetical protein